VEFSVLKKVTSNYPTVSQKLEIGLDVLASKFGYLIEIFCLGQGESCTLPWLVRLFRNLSLREVVDFGNIELSLKLQCYTLNLIVGDHS